MLCVAVKHGILRMVKSVLSFTGTGNATVCPELKHHKIHAFVSLLAFRIFLSHQYAVLKAQMTRCFLLYISLSTFSAIYQPLRSKLNLADQRSAWMAMPLSPMDGATKLQKVKIGAPIFLAHLRPSWGWACPAWMRTWRPGASPSWPSPPRPRPHPRPLRSCCRLPFPGSWPPSFWWPAPPPGGAAPARWRATRCKARRVAGRRSWGCRSSRGSCGRCPEYTKDRRVEGEGKYIKSFAVFDKPYYALSGVYELCNMRLLECPSQHLHTLQMSTLTRNLRKTRAKNGQNFFLPKWMLPHIFVAHARKALLSNLFRRMMSHVKQTP